jgi:hypothetical protein
LAGQSRQGRRGGGWTPQALTHGPDHLTTGRVVRLLANEVIEAPPSVNITEFGTLMPSITLRLGLLLLLGLPCAAKAETAPLNVPILMQGAIGEDACSETGKVIEIGQGAESFLPVQSGPGEAPFREIGRLYDGDVVKVCEKLGPWIGVVYGSALLGCQTTILVPVEQNYTGPCEHGWVLTRYVSLSKE